MHQVRLLEMLKETEKEFKYLVNAELFQALLSKCNEEYPFIKQKLQANYYYDTEDNSLNKSRTTVRIRQQQSDMKLQIKRHRENKDGLATSDEYSGQIDTLPSTLKIPDVYDVLIIKGVLVTARTMFSFGKNSTICFDSNMYLGICDYELEIEVDDADVNLALMAIEDLGLNSKSFLSKSERFFERLEEINHE